jgi:hypothetical protein
MPATDVGFFVFLINAFKDALTQAAENLYPWVLAMLGLLLFFELVRVCWGIGVEGHKYAALATFLLKLLLLCLIIPRWEYFFTTLTTLGVTLGLHAGGDRLTQKTFLNPGAYLQLGTDIGGILYQQWDTSQMTNAFQVVLSPVLTVAYFLAWVVFLLAFFIMGLLVFMVQIEAAFALPGLLVLLPFLAFGKTGWIGQGVVTYAVKLAYKFFMLAMIASIVYPIAKDLTIPAPDIRQAIMFDFAAIVLVACFIAAPMMARNMISGVFTLGAGSAANAALLALHTVTLGQTTLIEAGRRTYNAAGHVLHEASGGRVQLPLLPPPRAGQGQILHSLRDGARHLHD